MVCAWKAWFQDAKITAHRPEKTWAVIFNNQIISDEPSSVAPFLFIILASLHFYVNFLYKISFALWHATECPLEISWSFGTPFLQASVAYGQRVTERQPSGIFIGLGSSPLSWILLCAKTSFLFSTIISFSNILYDNIIRSFANSPPLTSSNFASRSATFRFFFSSPDTS